MAGDLNRRSKPSMTLQLEQRTDPVARLCPRGVPPAQGSQETISLHGPWLEMEGIIQEFTEHHAGLHKDDRELRRTEGLWRMRRLRGMNRLEPGRKCRISALELCAVRKMESCP